MKTLSPQIGPFITRVSLGVVLIAHSVYLKLMIFTLPGTVEFFASIGLHGSVAYLVLTLEVLAGMALIVGYRVRLAAALVVPVLLGATMVHWSAGWLFTNTGGGWEYPLFLATTAIAQVFLGAGSFALSGSGSSALKSLTSTES